MKCTTSIQLVLITSSLILAGCKPTPPQAAQPCLDANGQPRRDEAGQLVNCHGQTVHRTGTSYHRGWYGGGWYGGSNWGRGTTTHTSPTPHTSGSPTGAPTSTGTHSTTGTHTSSHTGTSHIGGTSHSGGFGHSSHSVSS